VQSKPPLEKAYQDKTLNAREEELSQFSRHSLKETLFLIHWTMKMFKGKASLYRGKSQLRGSLRQKWLTKIN